jgi:phage shock protein C
MGYGEIQIMQKLYRSRKDIKIAGICAGIGEMTDVDPTIIRLITVLLVLMTGILPGVVTYLIAWLIIPEKPE